MTVNELKVLSYELRQNVLDMVMSGKGGHLGGDMSVMDLLVTLYFKVMNVARRISRSGTMTVSCSARGTA